MKTFEIAGIKLLVDLDILWDNFTPFLSQGSADIVINSSFAPPFAEDKKAVFSSWQRKIYLEDESIRNVFFDYQKLQIGSIIANKTWDRFELLANKEVGATRELLLSYFPMGTVMNCNDGIFIHASLINYDGKGIVFTAPSGTGKSTQANLWQQHMGARLINGDRVAIKNIDGEFWGYGSPWAGSSGVFLNEKVKLSAIVILGQAKENIIHRVTGAEAAFPFMSQADLPVWDKNIFPKALDTVNRLLTTVPVFKLDCLPDKGAVDALKNELSIN